MSGCIKSKFIKRAREGQTSERNKIERRRIRKKTAKRARERLTSFDEVDHRVLDS